MCSGGCGSHQAGAPGNAGACQNPGGGNISYDESGSGLTFTRPSATMVGTPIVADGGGYGPSQLPEALVTVTPDMLGYQDMWIGDDGTGRPAAMVYPGSYGQLYQANSRGA
jgi:hypothetical protein